MTPSTPKISDSPDATMNSSMPMMSAVEICVTAQAPDDRQAARASRFKEWSSEACHGRARPGHLDPKVGAINETGMAERQARP